MSDHDSRAADRLDSFHRQMRDGGRRGWRSFADSIGDRDPGAEPNPNSGASKRKRRRQQPRMLGSVARALGEIP